MRYQTSFTVPSHHPALAGHFPGAPVVPGVVVLDLVLKAAERCAQQALQVGRVPQVKFVAPLRPEEPADIALELRGETLQFQVTRAGERIAQGSFILNSPVTKASAP